VHEELDYQMHLISGEDCGGDGMGARLYLSRRGHACGVGPAPMGADHF
jgi:hypothetical protein